MSLINNGVSIHYDNTNSILVREIGDIRWFNIDDAVNIIRPENVERKSILLKAVSILKNYCPFMHGRLFRTPL